MVREIRGLPVLQGARGAAPADLGAIEAMLLQVSRFMASHPDVAELDLHPGVRASWDDVLVTLTELLGG